MNFHPNALTVVQGARVMSCRCGGVLDYVYGIWHVCRRCQLWRPLLLMLLCVMLLASTAMAQSPTTVTLDAIDQKLADVSALLQTLRPPTLVVVPSGADLTSVIATAPPGVTVKLAEGGVYGPFSINRCDVQLVGAAGPLDRPTAASKLPRVQGLDQHLHLRSGACNVEISGIEWAGVGGGSDMIVEERGAYGIKFHHNYVHGDGVLGQKRGIALFGGAMDIDDNTIVDIKRKDQDTQTVASYDGTGPYNIRRNVLQASGENVIFGGDDPSIMGLIPSNIVIDDNIITKPLEWKGVWNVKNLIELKNAMHVKVRRNVFEGSWLSGQEGYALVLTVRNQSGKCLWCILQDVEIVDNIFRHSSGGINILGRDDKFPSGIMQDIVIARNSFEDINPSMFQGAAKQVLIQGGPINVTLDTNKFSAGGTKSLLSFLAFGQPQYKAVGLIVTNNEFQEGQYGITGDGAPSLGQGALGFYAPDAVWANNMVHKGTSGRTAKELNYPVGTVVVP